MSSIFRLAYAQLGTTRIETALEYYTGVLGARLTADGAGGVRYLSFGLDHHNLALAPAADGRLTALGFQLSRGLDVETFARRLKDQGLKAAIESDSRPGAPTLAALDLAGFRLEFIAEMAAPAPGFGRVGIAPLRLGHIALMTPEAKTLVKFFTEVAGFHLTDWFEGIATFLTCNHDHHVVNVLEVPFVKMHHIAFQLSDAAHQHRAADLLAANKLPIVWGPSRHTAGHNLASYHYDPDRRLVELYAEMDVYLPDLGYMEPRPWHEDLPQRPKVWPLSELNAWRTAFDFDMARA